MQMLCQDEKLLVQVGSWLVRKRNGEEDKEEDEPARKKMTSSAGRSPESQYQTSVAVRTNRGASEVSYGKCHRYWLLPGKLSGRGKSSSTPVVGLVTEGKCVPDTAACSMDCEDAEGGMSKEEYGAKVCLTEPASPKLSQVLKLESELRREGTRETNCVVEELPKMETESVEPEKKPELYYYM